MTKSPNLSANNMVRLNRTHSFLKLQTKFSNLRSVFWQNFQRIRQNLLNSPTYSTNNAKFAPFMYPLYFMFQIHATAKNSLKIPVNQAEFAQFAYRCHE